MDTAHHGAMVFDMRNPSSDAGQIGHEPLLQKLGHPLRHVFVAAPPWMEPVMGIEGVEVGMHVLVGHIEVRDVLPLAYRLARRGLLVGHPSDDLAQFGAK